jgi:hypothetical protein
MIPIETIRRVQVLEIRQRLERVAAHAHDQCCDPAERGIQSGIERRLAFILAADHSTLTTEHLHGVLRIARHLYSQSSDVLHGRTSMVNFPQVVLDEWYAIVEQLESIYDEPEL